MRATNIEDQNKEMETGKRIKEMWARIDNAVYEQNTTIRAVAIAAGVSPAAAYTAIRKTQKTGEYIDSLLSFIVALAKELNLDIDYVLTGKKHLPRTC